MEELDLKREVMIGKITKLLAKADGAGVTAEEAETFFAKAQELMTKWAIDEQMLKLSGKMVDDKIKTVYIAIASTYFMAQVSLWDNVARANDCVVMYSKGSGKGSGHVVLTGHDSDIGRVQLLVTSLQVFALREAQRESKRMRGDYYFRRSFIQGFASRIGSRLREQRDLNVKEASDASGGSLLPALVDKRNAVETYIAETMKVRKSSAGRNTKFDLLGALSGREAANRADLGNTRIGR